MERSILNEDRAKFEEEKKEFYAAKENVMAQMRDQQKRANVTGWGSKAQIDEVKNQVMAR